MFKKVITNLDLSKASGSDCVPVVDLRNCEPELSYVLAELFNESFILISSMVLVWFSTKDLLAVLPDRIAWAFNRSGATRAVALNISKASGRVGHAEFLHKLHSYGISGQVFGLISSFFSNQTYSFYSKQIY